MSVVEKIIDVLEHLVATHPSWNQALSQEAAKVKLVEARVEAAEPTVDKTVADATVVVDDAKKDVPPVVSDLEKLAQEAEGK